MRSPDISHRRPQRPPQRVAVVEEDTCIGCALCIKACPVDAIIGAHSFTHTVIERECIGCELCVAPCPVDCIAMVAARASDPARERAHPVRERRRRHRSRLSARARRYADATRDRRDQLKEIIRKKLAGAAGDGEHGAA